ncbi:hypothetical protein HF086_013837 [Spodoptera exigua]|uniref:C2H2-type domain-containing protein n=1 Tax=Spodoptera exigua TaxID=7107 RepID=A0A922M9E3_SPOEX|nr:hypothetical protein HF086_013837 [Spodoptera exigua]
MYVVLSLSPKPCAGTGARRTGRRRRRATCATPAGGPTRSVSGAGPGDLVPRHATHATLLLQTKKSLEGHLRSHSGERPFACTTCGATFGYEAALYNHTRLVHLKHKLGRGRPPPTQAAPSSGDAGLSTGATDS